jgi:hypothetical protein
VKLTKSRCRGLWVIVVKRQVSIFSAISWQDTFILRKWWSFVLYHSNILIVLAHWNNSPLTDMLLHSDTLSWFQANLSFFYFLFSLSLFLFFSLVHFYFTTTSSFPQNERVLPWYRWKNTHLAFNNYYPQSSTTTFCWLVNRTNCIYFNLFENNIVLYNLKFDIV